MTDILVYWYTYMQIEQSYDQFSGKLFTYNSKSSTWKDLSPKRLNICHVTWDVEHQVNSTSF